MTSESGITPSYKSPVARRTSSATASDDEISVIAVIKKGTSGIPKRARYHYIRELPLASVKSIKKSLQKAKDRHTQVGVSIPAVAASSNAKETVNVVNDVKRPRIIELSDEASKMELRKQFKMAEKVIEDKEQPRSGGLGSSANGGSNVVHKLPPGTVLIKQEPRTPGVSIPEKTSCPESNTNCSSAGATTTTASTSTSISSASSSASSISSCGSGSSSGGFGSVPASPSVQVKRLHRAPKGGSRKKIVDVVPRRNPKRSGSKKGATIREVVAPVSTTTTTLTTRPRQRQRLLTTRREERDDGASEAGTNRRTKPATMPYMNTRSVTRKLYTVGATYQAPTRKDETEWREWPVHGMHERPVFHPQVGLAAGYAGRVFWTTTNDEGMNCTYREVLDSPEEVEVVPVDPRPKRTTSSAETGPESSEESFEVCMHESLHSVLAYCAQVMAPDYRRAVAKKRRHDLDARSEPEQEFKPQKDVKVETKVESFDSESTRLNLTELENSSISDETLMEMSSIYKKLLPIEDQPSSGEESPSSESSPSSGNNCSVRKIAEDRSATSKNSSEASEIARILSEYNDSLKEKGFSRPFSSTNPNTALCDSIGKNLRERIDPQESEVQKKPLTIGNPLDIDYGLTRSTEARDASTSDNEGPKLTSAETAINDDHWLEDLLVDTSLLYCFATGVGQRDLTQYVNSLDAKQSLQWLRHRNG